MTKSADAKLSRPGLWYSFEPNPVRAGVKRDVLVAQMEQICVCQGSSLRPVGIDGSHGHAAMPPASRLPRLVMMRTDISRIAWMTT